MKTPFGLRNRGGLFGSRGSVVVIAAVFILVVIAMAGLAIDIGMKAASKSQMENVAASAALACESGLSVAPNTAYADNAANQPNRYPTAYQRAKDYAALNKVMGKTITLSNSDILIGKWDAALNRFKPYSTPNACQVTMPRTTVQRIFSKAILRNYSTRVTSKAIAQYGVSSGSKSWNMTIVQDNSASMDATDMANAEAADKSVYNCIKDNAGTGSQVGFIKYGGTSAPTSTSMRTPTGSDAVYNAINALGYCNSCMGTNTDAAIDAATAMLDALVTSRPTACTSGLGCAMTIVTDGEPNAYTRNDGTVVSCNNSDTTCKNAAQAAAVASAQAACNKGYKIFVIYYSGNSSSGLSNAQALTTLTTSANCKNGTFFNAPSATDLQSGSAGICASLPPRLVYQN